MRAQRDRLRGRAGGPRAQRRGGVPPAHRLGHRGGRPPRASSASASRSASPATPSATCDRDAAARSARLPSEALTPAPRRACSTGPCSCRRPASATRPGWPATAAVRRPCARSATDRCASAGPRVRPSALVRHRGPGWACPECGGRGLRAPVLGDARTAEEIGRALPGVTVRQSSSGERVLAEVDDQPAIVVATPGAEPVAAGGYAAVLLLDTWLLLGRADLRATEEAVRRWANAAALVRPAADGGRVLAVGDPAHPGLQALIRWDPAGLARREIDERRPPTCHRPRGSPRSPVSPTTSRRPCRASSCRPAPRCSARCRSRPATRATRSRSATSSASPRVRPRRCPPRSAAAGPAVGPQAAAPARRGGPGPARLTLSRARTSSARSPTGTTASPSSRSRSSWNPSGNSRRPRPCTTG